MLKARKGRHFARKLQRRLDGYAAGEVTLAQVNASVQGWVNHARFANTVGLRKTVLRRAIVPRPGNVCSSV